MRAKVRVRETALYEVWLDVEDPSDQGELEEAWTNLPTPLADTGMVGYTDRSFDVLTMEYAAAPDILTAQQVRATTLREAADLIEAMDAGASSPHASTLRSLANRIELDLA